MKASKEKTKNIKITFCSGAESVTGSNFLLEFLEENNKKILVDCGLYQGSGDESHKSNRKDFFYKTDEVEILFITHAHIDHIGRIPKLISDGFKGKIYSTLPTKDLALPMLEDEMNILAKDKEHGLDKIYTEENIKKALSMWETLKYHEVFNINEHIKVRLLDSGHILGSAMVEFIYNGKKIVFTGDLGNSPSPLLPDNEELKDVDYLIMEAVYGDRNHESRDDRKKLLEKVIEDNVKRKGTLMIPTFSLERTQELLFEIDDLVENNRIPMVPFFLDSPLAIKLTDLYKRHSDYFNDRAKGMINSGNDIFIFSGLRKTLDAEDSKMILKMPDPKVIIAGSGMSTGGRIIHHEKNYLPNPNNTLLLTGYQSQGTLGRAIQDGAREVTISGEKIPIKARIENIEGYSGHKDSDNLIRFVENTAETLRKVFVVMAEPKSSLFLVQRLRDYLGIEAYAPKEGDSVVIEC